MAWILGADLARLDDGPCACEGLLEPPPVALLPLLQALAPLPLRRRPHSRRGRFLCEVFQLQLGRPQRDPSLGLQPEGRLLQEPKVGVQMDRPACGQRLGLLDQLPEHLVPSLQELPKDPLQVTQPGWPVSSGPERRKAWAAHAQRGEEGEH